MPARRRSDSQRWSALAASRAEERLDALRTERRGIETELADAAGGREGATAALYRLGTVRERIAMRSESASELRERFRLELAEAGAAAKRPGLSPAELEAAANEATAAARAAAHARDDLLERASLGKERLAALERSLAEREGIPPAARALADEGAELALSLLDVDSGNERAVAAALAWRASAVMADDAAAGLALLQRARDGRARESGRAHRQASGRACRRASRRPSRRRCSRRTVASVTEEGFGFDPQRGELWFAGEAAEAVLLELESRRRELEREVSRAAGAGAGRPSAKPARRRRAPRRPRLRTPRSLTCARHARPIRALLRRLVAGADRLDEALIARRCRCGPAGISRCVHGPMRAPKRAAELGAELARVGGLEHEARRESTRANERAAAAELERARLGGEGQIRMLHVDEPEREQVEREARELTEEAERLAVLAAEAGEMARVAAADTGCASRRRCSTPISCVACLPAPSDWTRRSPLRPPRRPASTHRCGPGSTRARRAPASSGAQLRDLGAAEVALRQGAEDAAQRATEVEIELTRIEG